MKPTKFALNSIIVFISFAEILFSFISFLPWQMFFAGLGIIAILVPDWILSVKHGKKYLVYKGISQGLFAAISILLIFLGGFLWLTLEVVEDIAEGCGGVTNITTLDKIGVLLLVILGFVLFIKVIFNIIEFARYKKERRKIVN